MKFSEGNAQQQAAMLVFRADNKRKYTEEFPYCDAFQAGVDLFERLFCKRWPAVEAKRLLDLILNRAWDYRDPVNFLHVWAKKSLEYNKMGLGLDYLQEIFAEEGESEPVDNMSQEQKSRQEIKAFDEAIKQGYVVPLDEEDMSYYGWILPN